MKKHRLLNKIILFLFVFIFTINSFALNANATQDELNEEAEERKKEPVETNEIKGWPQGPVNGAEGAILMDAASGTILYGKNIDTELFPASTTKIMTCLVAIENCDLDEVITISQSAIDANDPDGSNMGLKAGETLTLEELLYGILINSANEACNAVGEHIAGSQEAYVEMMNEKAKELGCTHTHFVTTNGLSNPEHYTSAHDLALIAKEFYKYDILCKIASTGQYTIPENSMHREFYLVSHNKLTSGREYAYEGLVGSKTGFTSLSRQTLVSCAERDGVRLICVILKEESPFQFTDTVALFDYGFSNFHKLNVESNETKYTISCPEYLTVGKDLYGYPSNLINIDGKATLLIPDNASFGDLGSRIIYGTGINTGAFGSIYYTYNNAEVGNADISLNPDIADLYKESIDNQKSSKEFVIFNINKLMLTLFIILGILVLFMIFGGIIKNFIDNQIRIAKIKKARKENEPKRRPVHKKYKKENEDKKDDTPSAFSKKRKHTVYKKPEVTTLYDKDARKPGNRMSRKISYNQIKRKIRRKEFFEEYERIDIDIDEDD